MLKHAKGNLIDMAEQGLFDIIVHGCNCQNTMGSGIAKEIRARYPLAYTADTNFMRQMPSVCKLGMWSNHNTDGHGSVFYGVSPFVIVNAYTQVNYLPRCIDHFEYDSFALILRKLAAVYPGKRFGFPYIGMGLAGGDSKRILAMLESFAVDITSTGGSATLVEFG
jgi:O-acetyl-ADP-ribose deacetylase (regulator of RNase III)